METKLTRPGPSLADDNQDVDPKPDTHPKVDTSRSGMAEPKPLSADPPDEDIKTDPGSKTDRAGEVKPRDKG